MVLNVAFDILTPDDRVIVIRFEELRNVFGPRLDGLKPILAEDTGQVSLDSNDSGGGKVVTKNPKRRDSLPIMSEFGRIAVKKLHTGWWTASLCRIRAGKTG